MTANVKADGSRMRIMEFNPDTDSGNYTCEGENDAGIASASIQLISDGKRENDQYDINNKLVFHQKLCFSTVLYFFILFYILKWDIFLLLAA